ncbi:uncharacterized membrane protein YcaP (DUF421 family) [Virgibacillus natechei]|uniref:Uncharacterized membrane protein YcaP (DUF421 family) n=1 Tax=Virgibacillus natechei TaxID=1216297 RepID=A0ABS4IGV2_9BACI|nr:DUF421 domain-containing protein [Virgibacillus natechei]MBP1970171.1 uncharacterized membrane protein YcaP (DUF421 family) [Virgibacillus natechei]UZD12876.1 DUF421 domain-containing protein [Virgibacillus natechei]
MAESVYVLIRGLSAFVLMFVLTRMMGKRHITQLTYYDYIVGISIGSIAAKMTFDPHVRMSNFILAMLIWTIIPIILSKLELKSNRFRDLMEGDSVTLIKNGKILEENLKKETLTVDELMVLLRRQGFFKISDIESAILEKDGELSVMKRRELEPLTPTDVGMDVQTERPPCITVVDGNLLEKTMNDYGYTKEWLLEEVKKQGATDFSDVFLAQIDSMGNVYVDLYDDNIKSSKIKDQLLLAANIKQLQSNLVNFSLQTDNKEAKKMYNEYAKQMDQLMEDMSVYLKE